MLANHEDVSKPSAVFSALLAKHFQIKMPMAILKLPSIPEDGHRATKSVTGRTSDGIEMVSMGRVPLSAMICDGS